MLKFELGTFFLLAISIGDLQLRCFGRQLDLLPDGIFWNRTDNITSGQHWTWGEVGERLRFWRTSVR